MPLHVHLRAARLHAGWSVSALAEAVGLSRQAYTAIEAGRAIPATDTALRLAQALDTRVEALFGLAPPPQPATTTRTRAVQIGDRQVQVPTMPTLTLARAPARPDAPVLVLAGCDPATDLIRALLRERHGVELLWVESGSQASLDRLARGEAHIAGSHLPDTRAPAGTQLVHLAVWQTGLVVARDNPLGLAQAADLARPGLRLVNREPGSGSRRLLDERLRLAGLPGARIAGYDSAARGHFAVAAAIASGLADAGVATQAAAQAHGLGFVPWVEEAYRLVVPTALVEDPAVRALFDLLRTPRLREEIEALGGYDGQGMGEAA